MTDTQASPLPKQLAESGQDTDQGPRRDERLQFVSLLFELHRGSLMRHLTGLLTRRADAEDVLQETCTRLLKVKHLDSTPVRARAYMFRIATNLAYDRRVNIVPEAFARQLPVRLLQRDDADIPDDEWVSRVITVTKGDAAHLVPILRPLLPQAAHMASLGPESGKLLIVDRYANVRRITEIVEALDR